MATVNKDFKIKSGLIVEGTTGTINGENILTEASTQFIIDTVGGSATSANTPDTVVLRDGSGNFAAGQVTVTELNIGTIGHIWDDGDLMISNIDGMDVILQGEDIRLNANDDVRLTAGTNGDVWINATSGVINLSGPNIYAGENLSGFESERVATQGYVDDSINNIDLTFNTDEITEGTTNLYFTNQRALDATSSAYDAAGAASTAETNANNYTNTALEDYTPTASLDATVDGYGYLKSADLSGYATETYVNTAVDNLVDGAPGLLDTLNELAAAIADDENYATTMTTALAGKQATLTAGSNIDITADTISVTGLDSADISDFNTAALSATASAYDAAGAADTAENNANSYTDTQLQSYTTTASLETTIDGYGFAYTSEIPGSTDSLTEGTSNLYYTDARAKAEAAALLTNATLSNITITADGSNNLTITAENGVAGSDTDDLAEGSENLYFTDERAIDAVSGADIYPNAVILSNVAKQVATSTLRATAGTHVGVAFAKADYRSAEFLVKVAYGDHTEISKVLLTLDVNDNIAITEYGIVGTNGSGMTVSAGISGTDAQLLVTTANNNTTVTVVGTLLI